MVNVQNENGGMSHKQKYRILYHMRKNGQKKTHAMQEVIYREYPPMIQEIRELLAQKHGPEWEIVIINYFESQEDCG